MTRLLRRRVFLACLTAGMLASFFSTGGTGGIVRAQLPKQPPSKIAAIILDRIPKVQGALSLPPGPGRGAAMRALSSELLTITADGEMDVEFHAASAVGASHATDLRTAGATILASTADIQWPAGVTPPANLGIITARIAASRVSQAAAFGWVVSVTPAERQSPDVGQFTSEGVILHRTDLANAAGFTGAGVTVGVISDGVSNIAASQALGDLPPAVNVLNAGSGDEGTAMLEIVHDLAPGAALAFHGTGGGVGAHITALNALAAAGAQIITEDIPFDSEPAFQKGAAATAAESLAVAGILVNSSAGNLGNKHAPRVNGVGTGSGPDGSTTSGCATAVNNTVAIAGGGDTTFDVSVPAGNTLSATLQWSEPRAIFPTPGRGGFTDLDLFIVDGSYNCLAQSTAAQGNGVGDTLEQASWTNGGGSAVTVKLVVNVFGTSTAVAPPIVDLRFRGANATDTPSRAGSLNPDSNYTFGATSSASADASGSTDPATIGIEGSSAGGPIQLVSTTICPNGAAGPCTGVAGAPGTTTGAPTWTAADGVQVTGVGNFGAGNCPAISPGDCRFFGTSAATPHAAGVAALVLESLELSAGPLEIAQHMSDTARDRGPAGFDNTWGWGVLNALAAVGEESDLGVLKDCKPDDVVDAGQTATCTIYVDNFGPSLAREVVLTDTHIANGAFTIGTVTTSQGTCSVSSNVVTCALGELPAKSSSTSGRATVTVNVSATDARNINDVATVVADTQDPNIENNEATDSVTVRATADLRISKSDSPDPVIAGTNLTYTLSINNDGPSPATGVVVDDFVPAGLTIMSVSGTGGATCNAGVPGNAAQPTQCVFGTLGSGASRSMTIVTTVGAAVTGTINNDASVYSGVYDPDQADNSDTESTTVNASVDLSIQKSDSPDPVLAGRLLTYTLQIANAGPSQAAGVVVEDLLPDQVDFVSASFVSGSGACALLDVSPAPPTKKVSCQLGAMAPNTGSPVVININTTVKSATADGFVLSNTATVVSSTTESAPGNNSDTETTTVLNRADLGIVKTSDADIYKPSSTVIYTITVTNNGPSDALNVVVTDNLPDVKQAVYEFDTAGCTQAATTLTCSLGTVAAGSTRSFNVHLTVKGNKGNIVNTASVTSDTTDPVPGNNTASRTVKVGK